MYSVQDRVYSLQCTLYSVNCCTLCTYCAVLGVQFILNLVHFTADSLKCRVYGVQYTKIYLKSSPTDRPKIDNERYKF